MNTGVGSPEVGAGEEQMNKLESGKCPVCGSGDIQPRHRPFDMNTPIGVELPVIGYYCKRCGVELHFIIKTKESK